MADWVWAEREKQNENEPQDLWFGRHLATQGTQWSKGREAQFRTQAQSSDGTSAAETGATSMWAVPEGPRTGANQRSQRVLRRKQERLEEKREGCFLGRYAQRCQRR